MEKRQIPPFNPPNLDSCPVSQECKRIKEEVGKELLRDPEGASARAMAIAKEWGLEVVDYSSPWYKIMFRKLRYRLATEKAAKKRTPSLNSLKKITSN